MWKMGSKIPEQKLLSGGRKLVILTCSPFGTVEIDRASLSCIVMQRPESDSDAFFWFCLVFPYLFAFFLSGSV
ncbi:hypothetical protein D5805_25090 [Salmonella enterica subsp. enterica serovar Typhimurium]|nr:hypothetical protein [Salmonella enterica subsp. enterica serovar Typhimurium]EBY6782949.1 hypothetical protein [Salmonella enterica subsp. enterica serovar Typhimurium]